MKFEKRTGDGAPVPEQEAPQPAPNKGRKPVVVYIMVLFIAAFLLMALSFLMHQRSNMEALGELQTSVNALQEIQDTQDRIVELEGQLSNAEKKIQKLMKEQDDSAAEQLDALTGLYTLQQLFSSGDLDACRTQIQEMEDARYPELLSDAGQDGVTSPAQRYQQLKEAVLNS